MTDRCPTCGAKKSLSDPQRDLYFAMLGRLLHHPKLCHLSREQLHLYFKDKFLGGKEVSLPNGKNIYVLNSVARKSGTDVPTMSEYIDRIKVWCDEVGVWEVE
jgi:hypothetical protein